MAPHEGGETHTDRIAVAQRQFLVGDEIMVEEVDFDERARIGKRRLVAYHAFFEPRLRGPSLPPTRVPAASSGGSRLPVPSTMTWLTRCGASSPRPTARLPADEWPINAARSRPSASMKARMNLLAKRIARLLGLGALAEAREIASDGANAAASERSEVAPEQIRRGAERGAMQQDRRHPLPLLEIANFATVDGHEFLRETLLDQSIHRSILPRPLPAQWRACTAIIVKSGSDRKNSPIGHCRFSKVEPRALFLAHPTGIVIHDRIDADDLCRDRP